LLKKKIELKTKVTVIVNVSSGKKKKEKKEEGGVVIIPQESANCESVTQREKAEILSNHSPDLQTTVYITDLKRNFPRIEKMLQELNSREWASKMVTRTFYIKEGSVERMALTIANMLGIPLEKVEGLELKKGTWMQIQLSSPSIDLGNIGAIGKK